MTAMPVNIPAIFAVYKAKKNCIPRLWDYSAQKYTIERYQAYDGYDSDKNRLVCFQIYGAIDAKSGAWVMQVLHHGIYDVVNNNKVVSRTEVSSYYASSHHSGLDLGLNSYMSIFGGMRVYGRVAAAGRLVYHSATGLVVFRHFFNLMSKGKTRGHGKTSLSLSLNRLDV
jgi:hypothetical protein